MLFITGKQACPIFFAKIRESLLGFLPTDVEEISLLEIEIVGTILFVFFGDPFDVLIQQIVDESRRPFGICALLHDFDHIGATDRSRLDFRDQLLGADIQIGGGRGSREFCRRDFGPCALGCG